jgi:hypothetical protein
MPLLDTFKSEQQPFKLVFPRKGALDAHPQRMDGFVEEAFASALRGLTVAGILFEIGDQAGNELPRSKLRGINPPLAYSHGPASLAGWMLVYLVDVLHAHLRTTPTGRLGDAVAYSLLHRLAASHIGE